MSPARWCETRKENGERCGSRPLRGGLYCFMHDPDHAQEAAEARRVGGQRRRREGTVALAFDLHGLESVPAIRRLLEIAAVDLLALENTVARNRALAHVAATAGRLHEVGDLEQRLEAVEKAVHARSLPEPTHHYDDDEKVVFLEQRQ